MMSDANNPCAHCTFLNEPNVQICNMCSRSVKAIIAPAVSEDWNGIQCDNCTYLNASEEDICGMCQMPLFIIGDDDNEAAAEDSDEDGNIPNTDEMAVDVFPQQECKICLETIGTNYFAMFDCVHIFCNACAVGYFTNQITQRPIFDCICPLCNEPDLHSNTDKHEQYFSLLLPALKPILNENIINVLEKKLTELALSKDPNFVWCIRHYTTLTDEITLQSKMMFQSAINHSGIGQNSFVLGEPMGVVNRSPSKLACICNVLLAIAFVGLILLFIIGGLMSKT